MSKWFKNGRLWLMTIVVFFLLIFFFDRNDVMTRQSLKKDIRELEEQKRYYLDRIEEDSTVLERLNDDDFLEQYARENFYMKGDEDVVFIVPED